MKKKEVRTLFEGNWLTMHESVYINNNGEEVYWESVRRKKPCTGVVVVSQLMPSKRFVIIKQFRPAIQAYVLGFPAGLAYDNDRADNAIRELKEETGYTGSIVMQSPVLKTGSGVIDDSGQMFYMHIDENDPVNQNPQQELEPQEDIEVFTITHDEAKDFILAEQEKGTQVGSNLWYMFVLSDYFER